MQYHICSSTPKKIDSENLYSEESCMISEAVSPILTQQKNEISVQTMPHQPTKPYLDSSLQQSITSPLNKSEEHVYTHLTRRKLHDQPQFLTCQTGGQAIHFVKVVKPRKLSNVCKSPLKKKRARELAKVRSLVAGNDSSCNQQSSELKLLSKSSKNQVCEQAGIKTNAEFTSQTLLAMKVALGLTTNQMRAHKRYLKNTGIKYASEKEERLEANKILANDLIVCKMKNMWHKDEKNPASIKGMVRRPSPCVYIADLPSFITVLLNDYDAAGKLIWNNFPVDEVWVKIGGDHGGGKSLIIIIIMS